MTAIEAADWKALGLDLAFCALPHGTTQNVIADLLARAPRTKVVDLSADFRLADPAAYARWYGHAHAAPELQKKAVYGLTEIYRSKIKAARLVANPGCYTTCAELALDSAPQSQGDRPRRDRHRRQVGHDRSGQGGEGGDAVFGGVRGLSRLRRRPPSPYGRTRPGILQGRRAATSSSTFTPHLVPMNRGILSTIYVRGLKASPQDLHAVLVKSYAKEPFVHVLPFGATPQTRHVRGSNMTFIGVAADRIAGRAIIVSALDNLTKGASGQAVQNMNVMLGFPETMGLEQVALFP